MDTIFQQVLNGIMIGSIYVLLAYGLSLIYGVLDIAHFAHGAVAIVGGYITYSLFSVHGYPLWLGIIVAVIGCGILGYMMELLAYRKLLKAPPINTFIVSLGLLLVIENVLLIIYGADQLAIRTDYGRIFNIAGARVVEIRLYALIACIILTGILYYILIETKLGKAIRAASQNKDAVVLMGVDIKKVYSLVFVLGSAIGAVAGFFLATIFALFPSYGGYIILKGFAVLILGGLGSIPGAIVGGFGLGIMETTAAGYISSAYNEVIAFLLMIAVLLFKPEGLLGKSSLKG